MDLFLKKGIIFLIWSFFLIKLGKNLALLTSYGILYLMNSRFLMSPLMLVLVGTLSFAIQNCSTRLVPREKVYEYNEVFLERTYVLKEDLNLSKDDLLKKGTAVKVYVESTPSLLKVKCYPVEESREYAVGRMAIYKINDEVEKEELDFDDLEAIIAEKFQPFESKKKKRR